METFAGRTAVITGGGSGIGLGLASALAGQGANLVVADLDAERAQHAAEHLHETAGVRTLAVRTDVSDPAQVDALADAAFTEFGAVHILVNNAGVATIGSSWEIALKDWSLAIGVNLMGVVHGLRAFVPRMIAGGEPGHIVNTASMAGLIPLPMQAPYAATKHACVGLTETLQQELHSAGAPIAVSIVCPGRVATNINNDTRQRLEAEAGTSPKSPTDAVLDQLDEALRDGISAADAGLIILDAIRNEHFWVFPGAQEYFPLVAQLHEQMFETGR